MRTEYLAFCRPSITNLEIQAVAECLSSGWITTGPRTAEFERAFAEHVGCPHAVAVSSATAGLHLVLKALGIGPGDEVITPSLTWVSTANLIALSGAALVLADVDRDCLMVTAETLRPLVTPHTRLMIPVHFAGAPADMDSIRALAQEHNLLIVEDAAHAAGTRYRDRPIGSTGTSVFSFHPIKNMTTGEGGMVCTDDEALAEHVRRLRFHGLGRDAFDRMVQGRAPQTEVLEPGYKYNLTDVASALGLVQLERLPELNLRRAEWAQQYLDRLATVPGLVPLVPPPYPHHHAWHLFVVRVDADQNGGVNRDRLMEELKKRNIGTGLHFRAIHTQKFYREQPDLLRVPLPHTEWNSDRICSLPLFPDMTETDVDDVCQAIHEILS